jgi:hypothetical protein
MGLSLEQIRAESDGTLFGVTVVSNEDDGIASYATGSLKLTKGRVFLDPLHHSQDALSSINGEDPILLFSDRLADLGGQGFDKTQLQRFDVNRPENLHLEITPGFGGSGHATVRLRVIAWTNHNFSFTVLPFSDLLVGIGPALSGNSPNAVYTFSFNRLPPGPH